jgi:cytochrome c-type biogenesis protein CcmH/NrfF
VGNRLHDNAQRYDLAFKESGRTVLLWFFPGSLIIVGPFIALHIIFKNTNALADEYNKKIALTEQQPS